MEIRVCIGSSCHLKGSRDVINRLNELLKAKDLLGLVQLKGSFCMGKCECKGIAVKLNDNIYFINSDEVDIFFNKYVIPYIPKAI